MDGDELFKEDPRKSKEERNLERKVELIKLQEHGVINGFPTTEKYGQLINLI